MSARVMMRVRARVSARMSSFEEDSKSTIVFGVFLMSRRENTSYCNTIILPVIVILT